MDDAPPVAPAPVGPSFAVVNQRIPTINTTPATIAAMIGNQLRRRAVPDRED